MEPMTLRMLGKLRYILVPKQQDFEKLLRQFSNVQVRLRTITLN
jgi:hypothetical protein